MTSYDLGIPNLQVGEPIGGGGFARVYRAHDTLLKRDLAIKILRPVMGQDVSATFENEAGLHGRLSRHANIVTIHHAGFTSDGAHPFLVMDLVTGGSLGDRLRNHGTVPWGQAVAWMIPICGAVQHVHDSGILHRDVKPDNILLDPPDTPLLGDLGIACLEDDTRPIEAMSFPYVAPEGLRGHRRDAPSDVFSLGTTLYELVAGSAPFGRSLEERVLNLDSPPPPLPDDAQAPAWLEGILRRALEAEPFLRIQSASQLQAELQSGLDSHRAAAPPTRATPTPAAALRPRADADAPGLVGAPGDIGSSAPAADPPAVTVGPDVARDWVRRTETDDSAWSIESLYNQPPARRRERRWRPLLRGLMGIALGVVLLAVALAVIEGVRASGALDGRFFDTDRTTTTDDDPTRTSDSFGAPRDPASTVTPTTGGTSPTTQAPTTAQLPTTSARVPTTR